MSLATRCSACGTMFRVVQDQLRVSEGWVRCGRCNHVFNALDALVDLAADTVAAQTAAAAATPAAPFADTTQSDGYGLDDEGAPPLAAAPRGAGDPLTHEEATAPMPLPDPDWDEAAQPMHAGYANARTDHADPDSPAPTLAAPSGRQVFDREDLSRPDLSAAPPSAAALAAQAPGFVRRAERDARWNTPAMRVALLGSALMLLALLGLQLGYHFRDALAASSPTAARWLHSACARWNCRIEPPRRIREVTLEGSALSRMAQQPQAVKLSINLRNRASTDLALPWVDLSLTDAEGKLIARRALSPADFRVDPPLIARGTELPLELVLGSGGQAINGYTVELFYP